jgi:surface polysaccharide O-acyltransferase-like enzyme
VAKIYPDPIAFTARNGPFFGPLFVAMGAHLAVRGETLRRIPVAVLALAVAAGLALFAGEALWIAGHGIKMVSNFNFLAGSAVFAPALFLLVLAAPMNRAWRFMARLGRYGVGMYCVHGLFTLLWNQSHVPADRLSTPLSVTFAAAVGVIVVSAVVTMALARAPLLRRFVT